MRTFNNIFKKINLNKKKELVVINILTRTSNRPNGFKKCHTSIKNQTFKNVRHIVSYDTPLDINYLNNYGVEKIAVKKKEATAELLKDSENEFKPYNLYCNDLLREVNEGWVMFLDDDDMLVDDNVLKKISNAIKKHDEDTLIIWQTIFSGGTKLPPDKLIDNEEIILEKIDTACFIFHSKYKYTAEWDCWWAADFRFVKKLSEIIPKQYWIKEVLTRKNNSGDKGRRNDI